MVPVLIMLTFGAVFLLVFGVNLLIADLAQSHREKVRKRLENEDQLRHEQRSKRIAMRHSSQKPQQEVGDDTPSLSLWQQFELMVLESGMSVRPFRECWPGLALGSVVAGSPSRPRCI